MIGHSEQGSGTQITIMVNFNKKTSNVVIRRIIFDIILFAAVFYAPFWLVAFFAFLGAFFCPPYYEIFLFGLLVDILYGASSFTLGGLYGILGAIVIFLSASYARMAVR